MSRLRGPLAGAFATPRRCLTLPANEIARTFSREHELPERRLDFVYTLEGREHEERAVVSDVAGFLQTANRSKWDLGK